MYAGFSVLNFTVKLGGGKGRYGTFLKYCGAARGKLRRKNECANRQNAR